MSIFCTTPDAAFLPYRFSDPASILVSQFNVPQVFQSPIYYYSQAGQFYHTLLTAPKTNTRAKRAFPIQANVMKQYYWERNRIVTYCGCMCSSSYKQCNIHVLLITMSNMICLLRYSTPQSSSVSNHFFPCNVICCHIIFSLLLRFCTCHISNCLTSWKGLSWGRGEIVTEGILLLYTT